MRHFLFLLGVAFLLVCSALSFAVEPCIECEELAGASQANLFTVLHEDENTLEITAFYENLSATPSRQPITNSIILVELSNSTGLSELYLIYTDSEGKASFDFSTWSEGCVNFRVLYCPFCTPDSPGCAFLECLRFANMKTEAGYYDNIAGGIDEVGDIQVAPGDVPLTINTARYLPEIVTANYCPPPAPLTQTPALCLPLLIIFSLLGGSLYLTGRNPFAGFALGAPRLRKHIRYMPRGRGFAQSVKTIAMSIRAAAGEFKTVKVKEGGKEVEKRAGAVAKPRWFGYSMVKEGLIDVVKGAKGALGAGGGPPTRKEIAAGATRARPGLKKIGAAMRRGARAAEIRRKERGTMAAWGEEVGLGIVRAGAAAWDSSWVAYAAGEWAQLSPRLESALEYRQGFSQQRAAMELYQEQYGQIESTVSMRPGAIVETDENGIDYVGIKIAGKEVKATAVGLAGKDSWMFETAVEGKQTRFKVTGGEIAGFQQVIGKDKTGADITVNFDVTTKEGKRIVQAASIVTTAPDGAQKFVPVSRDVKELVSQIDIGRDKAGEIVSAIKNNDGMGVSKAQIVSDVGLTKKNLADVTNQVNEKIQSTTKVYMEDFGYVKVTDNDVLKTSKGDYNIVVEDPKHHPLGEKVERPLEKGTVITVKDGQYTSIKNAAGNEIGFKDQRDNKGAIVKTTIAGTDIEVGRRGARDAGSVREHMNGITETAGSIIANEISLTNEIKKVRDDFPLSVSGNENFKALDQLAAPRTGNLLYEKGPTVSYDPLGAAPAQLHKIAAGYALLHKDLPPEALKNLEEGVRRFNKNDDSAALLLRNAVDKMRKFDEKVAKERKPEGSRWARHPAMRREE